ncbi:MAG: phosphoglucosamine mutase [Thiotrichaceae bacterium]|nr:phosphoglucosamine mutase [Thiotrichaceae bacterium]
MKKEYFGTDGIRGKVGNFPMTADFALKLGRAVGKVLVTKEKPLVIIGKDTRISGYMFEAALEAGLVSAGVDILLLGPMPTPAIAYLTRTFRASAGIVISASHNPYYDNGIKFFDSEGRKLSDEIEYKIESLINEQSTSVDSDHLGKAIRIEDAPGRYIEYCKRALPTKLSLQGLHLVVDCANGASYHIAPSVFEELGAKVTAIHNEPNGTNINANCGATSLGNLQQIVLKEKADLGIALDGDADRVMMVDKKGEKVDGDELIAVIAKHRLDYENLKADIVGTKMSNIGLELAMTDLGLKFWRADVGDRYVIQKLRECGGMIGGENSGHVIIRDCIETGDGIIAALQVLRAVVETKQPLHELKQVMKKYPQVLINISIKKSIDFEKSIAIQAAVKEVEQQLLGRGRVLLRASGTEPLIRVMVEGQNGAETQQFAEKIADVVLSECT